MGSGHRVWLRASLGIDVGCPLKPDPFDNPVRNAGILRNLNHNFQVIGVNGWLETVTFDQVVEAWWVAQWRKAERKELKTQSLTTSS